MIKNIKTKEELHSERLQRLTESIRSKRNLLISDTKWISERHKDEIDSNNINTTLSDEQYQEWLDYWQSLRCITNQDTFPENVIWPEQPEI